MFIKFGWRISHESQNLTSQISFPLSNSSVIILKCRISEQHCDAWGFGQNDVVFIQMYGSIFRCWLLCCVLPFCLMFVKLVIFFLCSGCRISWWHKLGITSCSYMPAIPQCVAKYVSISVLQGIYSVALAKSCHALCHWRKISWSSGLGP